MTRKVDTRWLVAMDDANDSVKIAAKDKTASNEKMESPIFLKSIEDKFLDIVIDV